MAISPEQARHICDSYPTYARVSDFKDIMSSKAKNRYDSHALAADALELPIDKTSTFPHWVIAYLHGHKDKEIEESDLMVAAIRVGYRKSDLRFVKNFLKDSQSNIGFWYDSKDKKTYYRWYQPNTLTKQVQECLDRGEDW